MWVMSGIVVSLLSVITALITGRTSIEDSLETTFPLNNSHHRTLSLNFSPVFRYQLFTTFVWNFSPESSLRTTQWRGSRYICVKRRSAFYPGCPPCCPSHFTSPIIGACFISLVDLYYNVISSLTIFHYLPRATRVP
jgi:hypothetical protein